MFQTIKDFYFKRKAWVILITMTTLLFFSGFFEPLWIVSLPILFLFYLTCDIGEIFKYSMYFNMFSIIGLFYIVSLIIGVLVIILKYIIDLAKKRRKFFVFPFVLTTFIALVFSLINYGYDTIGLEQGALVVVILYVIYFVFVYRDKININKCFKHLVYGIAVSLVLGLIVMLFQEHYAYQMFHFDGTYSRLKLFSYHQNHLAMHACFAISYFIYLILNRKYVLWFNVVCLVGCLIVGLLTLSKAFILMMVIFFLYFALYLVCKYKWKSLKVIVPVLVVMAIFAFAFKSFVFKIFDRFLAYNTKNSFINRITTGRSAIWYHYLKEITSSIPKMLFGVGLFGKELISIGCHNVLLFIVYRMGVVGLIALGLLAYSYYKLSGAKFSFKLRHILPFATYFILSFNEMIFSDRFFLYLVFGIMLMSKEYAEKTGVLTLSENEQNKRFLH